MKDDIFDEDNDEIDDKSLSDFSFFKDNFVKIVKFGNYGN